MTKATLKLLHENRQTLQSLEHKGTTRMQQDGENDQEKVDDEPIAAIIERVLNQEQFKDKRARNLDLDDFLQLLSDFNEAGIHFSS